MTRKQACPAIVYSIGGGRRGRGEEGGRGVGIISYKDGWESLEVEAMLGAAVAGNNVCGKMAASAPLSFTMRSESIILIFSKHHLIILINGGIIILLS